ncbi:S24 family peptidase [Rickettsiales bacterium LUAb2]
MYIKAYSSLFATKINYILDLIKAPPIQYGRMKAIENLVNEKATTVNNWLFNGKIPHINKQLSIADAIGVAYDYLYNNEVAVEEVKKPEIFFDGQAYLLPFIPEDDLFTFKNTKIYPVISRLPVMFPNFNDLISKYGNNIYITRLKNASLEPYIQEGSEVIYSERAVLENFKLVLHKCKDQHLVVKKLSETGKAIFVESFNKNKKFEKVLFSKQNFNITDFLFIILTYQKFTIA